MNKRAKQAYDQLLDSLTNEYPETEESQTSAPKKAEPSDQYELKVVLADSNGTKELA